jgi:hypothetical protein
MRSYGILPFGFGGVETEEPSGGRVEVEAGREEYHRPSLDRIDK